MKVLSNHYSQETAYNVESYPCGFRARCKIRYWLEVNNKGTRLWSQTTFNSDSIWNKAKASTYSVVAAMYLDDNEHVHHAGLSPYDVEKTRMFLDTYREGLTSAQIAFCERLIIAYDKRYPNGSAPINSEGM